MLKHDKDLELRCSFHAKLKRINANLYTRMFNWRSTFKILIFSVSSRVDLIVGRNFYELTKSISLISKPPIEYHE